jgi:hypothetical protein
MKTLIAFLLLSFTTAAQFPIVEEFNQGTSWVFTNGAGIQNYGNAENYGTTNVGNTPYPNNANVTITSPVYNLSTCVSGLVVSFPLAGRIENTYDFLRFQYRIGAGAWVTVQSFTGLQNATFSYSSIPNTATQFRFLLQTDATVNTFGPPGNQSVYYYDIARFNITCAAAMPVELISFTGSKEDGFNELTWLIESETNCDFYTVETSQDFNEWSLVGIVKAEGLNKYVLRDDKFGSGINYYRLSQTDADGTVVMFDAEVIAIDNSEKDKQIVGYTNLLGQPVPMDAPGVVIIVYSDGSIKRTVNY